MYFSFSSLPPAVPCPPFPRHLPNLEGAPTWHPRPVLIIHDDEHTILHRFSSFFLPNKVYSTFVFIILPYMCKNATQDASKGYAEYVQGGLLPLGPPVHPRQP